MAFDTEMGTWIQRKWERKDDRSFKLIANTVRSEYEL
jgi:hypothetical protein